MTPEMQLAQALSAVGGKEKTSSARSEARAGQEASRKQKAPDYLKHGLLGAHIPAIRRADDWLLWDRVGHGDKDARSKKKTAAKSGELLGHIVKGVAAGTATGVGAAAARHVIKKHKAKKIEGKTKKAALIVADNSGRIMAKQANLMMKAVGTAAKGIMRAPGAAGAVGGAALGAAQYATSNDPNKSLVRSVGMGAAGGAALQHGAKAAIPRVMRQAGKPGMMGQAGTYLRQANKAVAPAAATGARAARAGAQGAAAVAPAAAAAVPAARVAAPVAGAAPAMTAGGNAAQRVQHNAAIQPQGMLDRMKNGKTQQFSFAQPDAAAPAAHATTGLSPAEVATRGQHQARLANREAKTAAALRRHLSV